ncbi:hypothetical protein F5878DRAFT_729527 [Lentinula raphanica]|uniref:Helitron helicase-like domain-containing protein n=1 Tax=Lentinula raphanica TaxID=153919 RepID=A0AA38NWK3_9AGAR|nr:hypothetical protein F5878DRAFT_729527 [Lentinula raphanica]
MSQPYYEHARQVLRNKSILEDTNGSPRRRRVLRSTSLNSMSIPTSTSPSGPFPCTSASGASMVSFPTGASPNRASSTLTSIFASPSCASTFASPTRASVSTSSTCKSALVFPTGAFASPTCTSTSACSAFTSGAPTLACACASTSGAPTRTCASTSSAPTRACASTSSAPTRSCASTSSAPTRACASTSSAPTRACASASSAPTRSCASTTISPTSTSISADCALAGSSKRASATSSTGTFSASLSNRLATSSSSAFAVSPVDTVSASSNGFSNAFSKRARYPLQDMDNQRCYSFREATRMNEGNLSSETPLYQNKRSLGQQRRRAREAAEKANAISTSSVSTSNIENAHGTATTSTTQSRRSLGQQRRRARERLERNRSSRSGPSNAPTSILPSPHIQSSPERSQLTPNPCFLHSSPSAEDDPDPPSVHGPNAANEGFNPDYTAFVHMSGSSGAARKPYHEPVQRHDLGRMEYQCQHCKALHWLSERITGSKQTNPQFGMCCKHGEVQIPLLPSPPDYLQLLFTSQDLQAKEFRENIAQYNAALAFTSVGVSTDESVNHHSRGPPVFRIHGELKHWFGSLLPKEGSAPAYAQLYILDPQSALQYRMQRNGNLKRETMEALQTLIRAVN